MATRRTKRTDGRFMVSLTHEGKRHYFYGTTQKEANDKRQDAWDRIKVGAPVRDATRTLAEWMDEWVLTRLAISNRSRGTKIRHAGDVRRWINPTIGAVTLDKLNSSDVARLMLAMQVEGKAESTRRNCYDVLSVALDDAVDNGLLAVNPAHKRGRESGRKHLRPTPKRVEARFLTTEEAGALLAGAENLRYADVVRLILFTGLRRGEALALRWDGIDIEAGTAGVSGSLVRQEGSLIVSGTKSKASTRTICLSTSAVVLLKKVKTKQSAEKLEATEWTDSGLVFTNAKGGPVEPQNVLRTVRLAAATAGLIGVKVHTLRHTYATTALMAAVPLKVVSVNLGHASIQLTADTYGHVPDAAAKAAAEAVSAAFNF
jgi:integrase